MLKIYFKSTSFSFFILLIMYHENISAQPLASGYSPGTNNFFRQDQKETSNMPDLLLSAFSCSDAANRWRLLNGIKSHPSGYMETSGSWSNTNQAMATGFSWATALSQTIAGIPLTVNASLLVNSLNPFNKIVNGNISFDREQFLLNLREKLNDHLKNAYEPVFDTLNQITKTLKNYDSIRLLLNDKKYLQLLNDLQTRFDSIHKRTDSSELSIGHTVDLPCLAEMDQSIEDYETISRCYDKILDTVRWILSKYGSLDIKQISSQLSLPIDPADLNEEQWLGEIRKYGLAKSDQLLSGLKEFGVGELNIDQSPLTFNKKIANGLNISYAFKNCYFHLVHAREQLTFRTSEFSNPTPLVGNIKQGRLISQATIGIGDIGVRFIQTAISHIHNPAAMSTSQLSSAAGNTVVTLATGLVDKKGFKVVAETAGSLSTYFQSYPVTEIISTESVLKRTASRIAINKNINQSRTIINVEIQQVGPYFKNEGNSFLSADSRMLTGQVLQNLLENKLLLSARWNYTQYNRSALFQLSFYSVNYAIRAEYKIRGGNIAVLYNPIINSLPGKPSESKLHVVEGSFLKNYQMKKAEFFTSITLSNYRLQQLQVTEYPGDSFSNNVRLDFTQGMFLAKNLSLNAIVSFQTSMSDPRSINYVLCEAAINYEWRKCRLIGTFLFTQSEERQYPGGGLNAVISLWKQDRLAIQYSCQLFSNDPGTQTGILNQGTFTYTHSF
jgi:hypothetical protein